MCAAALRKEEVEELQLAVAGREAVQHAASDAGWLGLGLAEKDVDEEIWMLTLKQS